MCGRSLETFDQRLTRKILANGSIGKNERNEGVPSVEMVKKIADAFDVTLDYLVGEGQNAQFDKQTIKLLKEISNLPDKERDTVLLLWMLCFVILKLGRLMLLKIKKTADFSTASFCFYLPYYYLTRYITNINIPT